MLGLLGEREHRNSQINCISRLLTALSIPPTLFSTSICQQFAFWIAFFPGAARFLHTRPLWSFCLHVSHSYRLRQLERMHKLLLEEMKETDALFTSRIGGGDDFYLRNSRPALQAESQVESWAEVLLVMKGLQKWTYHLAKISHWKELVGWLPTILVWRLNAIDKTLSCHR